MMKKETFLELSKSDRNHTLIDVDGVPTARFVGVDEPAGGTLIPLEYLGYNNTFGYFDKRDFPNQPSVE